MPATVLETRRHALADDLTGVVTEAERMMSRDDFDPEAPSYTALREQRQTIEGQLTDVEAMIAARNLAQTPPPAAQVDGQPVSDFRRVLREYDRGHSPRVAIPYSLLRETQSDDPYFGQSPSRVTVAAAPFVTPSLDVVTTVQTANLYDFVVPPPVVAASTVAEGAKKPTVPWTGTKVSGELETDALIVDVSRQTLEDDASAESTLRQWLTNGVRLRQDQKVAAAITGATGTQTATGATIGEGLRNGKAELSELGIIATAAYLNPADAAALDLSLNADNTLAGVGVAYGMRLIETPAVAAGSPIVGAMGQAVYLLYRSNIQTYLTDSGMTDEATPRERFNHNLIGVLGEGRSKAVVVAPQLLCKVTVTPIP